MSYDFQKETWFACLMVGIFLAITTPIVIAFWRSGRAFDRWLEREAERRFPKE